MADSTSASSPLPPIDVDRLASRDPDALLEVFEHDQHPTMRARLPVLTAMVEDLVARYGDARPDVGGLRARIARLTETVTWHMQKEEQLLYPYIRALVEAERAGTALPRGPFGTVRNPIRMVVNEHLAIDQELREICAAIADAANRDPSSDACRAVLREITALGTFLHGHMTLEHEVVYPRAEEIEGRLPV